MSLSRIKAAPVSLFTSATLLVSAALNATTVFIAWARLNPDHVVCLQATQLAYIRLISLELFLGLRQVLYIGTL